MKTTTHVASRLSGVPVRTIQRWARQGRITCEWQVGRRVVDPVEVEELADRRHAGRLPRQQS